MNSKGFAASVLGLIAGTLAGVSTLSPWWTISAASGGYGGYASIGFLPGDSFTASANGLSDSFSYASQGWGPVEGLYEGILVLGVLTLIIAVLAGILGAIRVFGPPKVLTGRDSVQTWTFVAILIALVAVILVPLAQPGVLAIHPAGLCAATYGSKTPCNSFWGSVTASGGSVSWGADAGWYLELASFIILISSLVVWRRAILEPLGGHQPSRLPSMSAPQVGIGGSAVGPSVEGSQVESLTLLKSMSDSGILTSDEFLRAKNRVLTGGGTPTPGDSMWVRQLDEDLRRLEGLRASGAITPAEYSTLRQKIIARI